MIYRVCFKRNNGVQINKRYVYVESNAEEKLSVIAIARRYLKDSYGIDTTDYIAFATPAMLPVSEGIKVIKEEDAPVTEKFILAAYEDRNRNLTTKVFCFEQDIDHITCDEYIRERLKYSVGFGTINTFLLDFDKVNTFCVNLPVLTRSVVDQFLACSTHSKKQMDIGVVYPYDGEYLPVPMEDLYKNVKIAIGMRHATRDTDVHFHRIEPLPTKALIETIYDAAEKAKQYDAVYIPTRKQCPNGMTALIGDILERDGIHVYTYELRHGEVHLNKEDDHLC